MIAVDESEKAERSLFVTGTDFYPSQEAFASIHDHHRINVMNIKGNTLSNVPPPPHITVFFFLLLSSFVLLFLLSSTKHPGAART